MKRPTDAPSKGGMRFFTPQLYLRFNSTDDLVADAAQHEWEDAVRSYQEHLRQVRRTFPRISGLTRLNLHDAEVLEFDEQPIPFVEPIGRRAARQLFLTLRRDDEDQVVAIQYILSAAIRRLAAPRGWPFSDARQHWLYDEIDVGSREARTLIHRILFSDGRTVAIPFSTALERTISLSSQRAAQGA